MTRFTRTNRWLNNYAGALVIVLALVGSLGYVVEQRKANERIEAVVRQTACQASFAKAFAEAVIARQDTATGRTDSQDVLLNRIATVFLATPSTDPKVQAQRTQDFLSALQAFQQASGAAGQAKNVNPYPQLPSC